MPSTIGMDANKYLFSITFSILNLGESVGDVKMKEEKKNKRMQSKEKIEWAEVDML